MFGSKRRRAASNPPLNGNTANPAATTAATSAFLKNRTSNASLSSAAAAAALKARPMSPTLVADVQTKRTMRRAGSTSSVGSSVNGSQRSATPQLERRLSSGSMTERTFRDPSPGRPVPSAVDAPPVPAIPQNIQTHRRAASTEAPPARIASPVSRNAAGRGSSLGPQGSAVMRAGQRSSLTNSFELTSVEQRRGSVNFSYPTNSRPNSPTQKRLTSPSPLRQNPPRITAPNNQSLVYDPNTRSFLPAAEVHSIQQKINDVANQPVQKKKRAPQGNPMGSHLGDRTVGGRPKGTAVDALRAQQQQALVDNQTPVVDPVVVKEPPAPVEPPVPKPSTEPTPLPQSESLLKTKKKKKVINGDHEGDDDSYVPNSSDNDSDAVRDSPRRVPLLGKKPSIVREDREREELEDDTPKREQQSFLAHNYDMIDRNVSPTPLPRSKAGRGHGRELVAVEPVPEPQRSVSQPPPAMEHIEPVTEPNPLVQNGSARGARVSSLSPGRTAHFAATPDSLMVKHQPPPRSISPRKSALKHSNSRTSSPMPTHGSETSNSPGGAEDQIMPRKKSVRVSFDEKNVAVGEAAAPVSTDSPIVSSPQVSKRPWYSIGRGKKKESIVTDSEDDEVMKPRPALPSFGSIRERKHREVEERPLVKPADPVEIKGAVRLPILPSPINEVNENPLGQSTDHAVGAVLAQDSQTKNAANISKSREPLPPQVTSVEGSGYSSESDASVSAVDDSTSPTVNMEPEGARASPAADHPSKIAPLEAPASIQETHSVSDTDDASTPTQEHTNGIIPKIAISQPTPTPEESGNKKEWLDVPGSWESTSDSEADETARVHSEASEVETPVIVGIAEPTPDRQIHASPRLEAEHIYSSTIIEEIDESEADVFSDAAEELTDSDQEGFQSLNAAVESPITTSASMIPNPPESPTSKIARERAQTDASLGKPTNGTPSGDWNKAQEYWSGLSADKRRQLELDAMHDAESSDTEVEVKPAPKPKKKKKKVVKPDPPQPVVSNDRTYMIQPGSKAGPGSYTPMRTSMRTEAPPLSVETSMRKSMRGPAQSSMRDSMRGTQGKESRGSVQKKVRPVSLHVEPRADPTANKHSRNLSSASAAAPTSGTFKSPNQPALRRKNSSDSESSFKRARPSGERSMMRTMRGSTGPEQQQSSSRFSIRSLSPTGSVVRRPFGNTLSQPPDNQTHMRMSMRGSVGPTPTMRGPAGRAKSPSGGSLKLGFGFSSKPSKPQKSDRAPTSRFADSSDEEEARPAFRSRFIDSSDESDNDVGPPRPGALGRSLRTSAPAPRPTSPPSSALRGIPKRSGAEDGDSSDLPDSDDERLATSGTARLSKKRQTNGAPILNGSSQGANLASGSLRRSGSGRGTITTISSPPLSRPPHKRRGSIMSILRRKKDDTSKVRKSDAESPARRDTPLERSRTDLLAIKNDQTPQSPKLQKRNPLSRNNSFVPGSPSSPLVNQPPQGLMAQGAPRFTGGVEGRPFTADGGDGVAGAEEKEIGVNGVGAKPELGNRRFTADAINNVGFDIPAKKKKKFGALRKMFGLHN